MIAIKIDKTADIFYAPKLYGLKFGLLNELNSSKTLNFCSISMRFEIILKLIFIPFSLI